MTVAFIGHREIKATQELTERLFMTVENLIVNEGADTFLFGSKSRFDDLCYDSVTKLREKYPHIKRIYVRAEYEYISDDYRTYLLSLYEETVFPSSVHGAGAKAYIKRNEAMIDLCDKAVLYYDESFVPKRRYYPTNSGTRLAAEYAVRKQKPFINLFQSV